MPRLVDYDPICIEIDGRRGLGFTMLCPGHDKAHRIVVLFANPLDGGLPYVGNSFDLAEALENDPRHQPIYRGCGTFRWKRAGDSFDSMSISPSINAHDCGHFTVTDGGW